MTRLSDGDWKWVQANVPVACVDVVPVRGDASNPGQLRRVALILRDTPHEGPRWCIVGGRMLRNESLVEAIGRQLHETLGHAVRFELPPDPQPDYVAQYFTTPRGVGPVDPRQHAIGMTFVVDVQGDADARGEAHAFRWFDINALPDPADFGFGQDHVVSACLARRGVTWGTPPDLRNRTAD